MGLMVPTQLLLGDGGVPEQVVSLLQGNAQALAFTPRDTLEQQTTYEAGC